MSYYRSTRDRINLNLTIVTFQVERTRNPTGDISSTVFAILRKEIYQRLVSDRYSEQLLFG